MFNHKKINFWRLVFIFSGIVLISLFSLWSYAKGPAVQMMNGNMSSMMKQMHTSNITIYDLFGKENSKEQMNEMSSHHQNQQPIIYKMNYISTAIIFLLLPLIIGGAVILAIVWIR